MTDEPDRGEDAEGLVVLLIQLSQIAELFDAEHGEIEVAPTLTVAQAHGAYRELLRLLMGEGPYTEATWTLRLVPPTP